MMFLNHIKDIFFYGTPTNILLTINVLNDFILYSKKKKKNPLKMTFNYS